jgi:hypothetical protein
VNNATLVRQYVVTKIDQFTSQAKPVTSELIRGWVDTMTDMVEGQDHDDVVDRTQLVKDIEADFNVHVGNFNWLADDGDHVPWLDPKLEAKGDWKFWSRYERYLRNEVQIPPAAVRRLDEVTDDILARLEDPTRAGAWDRRGLVAGQVQSGKTGNYTGLIAKAIDNDYKLIVVLAGVHNSLRSQTQARIDEGILGFDTRAIRKASLAAGSNRIGVGKLAGPWLHVNSFTSSLDKGDFSIQIAQGMGVAPGGSDPIVLVVKKNKSILTNLYKWATMLKKVQDPETGEYKVPGVPVLVIDDEADHASVNTKDSGTPDDETDPSIINSLIRNFLKTFEQSAYVAYTATPFANIFIDPEANHSASGEDIFPRSFIVNLPAPSNYVGPERVFGLDPDPDRLIDAVKPLKIVRDVGDYDEWLPDRHKATTVPGPELPASLKEAIVAFLMAGAVRALRGQEKKHHSMLIHVTRFVDVQRLVSTQVGDYLEELRSRLIHGEGANPILRDQVAQLYTTDLRPTAEQLASQPDLAPLVGHLPALEDLLTAMRQIAERTVVHEINGKSADALEYVDHPDGISVIAIGGDKLSRGLTLEGLCVSYYLRASKMYDTLMQMGRWFGYRPGYLDVCRLYTTPVLQHWYKAITSASAELQSEFDAMAATGGTPADFGLRVRQLPDGLLVTAPSKLRNATKYSVTFSGTISETVTFSVAAKKKNFGPLEGLISSLGPEDANPVGGILWRAVDPETILEFLGSYVADKSAFKSLPGPLADYIRARTADGELTSWTVLLADVGSAATAYPIGGRQIGLTERQDQADGSAQRYTVRRVVSPGHELVDFVQGGPEWNKALQDTIVSWKKNPRRKLGDVEPKRPSGRAERAQRPASDGLLILYPLDPSKWSADAAGSEPFVGFALSFPFSTKAKPLEYQVNPVFLNDVFGWGDDDDA